MKNSLLHEFYKFIHRRIPLYGILILLALMLYTIGTSYKITPSLISQGFGAGQWATIIVIAISSDMIAMEWRDHTMATLMYKASNRSFIYIAKFIELVVYSLVLPVFGVVFSLIFKALIVGSKYSWSSNYYGHSLISALVLNMIGTMIYSIFVIALSLMLISLIKNNATVIMIGLAIGFFGANLSSLLMNAFQGLKSILAWNPLNMINIITQLSNSQVMKYTDLTNSELIIANLVYAAIFFWIGLKIFKNRAV
ncbi:MAG: ABC transporter permease [Lactobacillus sp.]